MVGESLRAKRPESQRPRLGQDILFEDRETKGRAPDWGRGIFAWEASLMSGTQTGVAESLLGMRSRSQGPRLW